MDEGMLLRTAVVLLGIATISSLKIIPTDAGEAPRFKRAPLLERLAVAKDSISLRCKVTGSPKPYIEWFYNGEQLSISERIRIKSKSLVIVRLQVSDSGTYSCKASNEVGILWANFTLKVMESEEESEPLKSGYNPDVQSAPEWSQKKDSVNYVPAEATKEASLNCDVRGYPTPSITWYKDGQEIILQEDKYVKRRWKLKVLDLTLKDSGNYTCVVSNKLGSIKWTFQVDVIERLPFAPIIEEVKDVTAVLGQDAVFTCKIVASDSQPILQWLQHYKVNDSYVNENEEPYVHVLKQSGFLKTVDDPQTLRLKNVTENDEGWYSCVVTNTVGMNYKSAYLTVLTNQSGTPDSVSSVGSSLSTGQPSPQPPQQPVQAAEQPGAISHSNNPGHQEEPQVAVPEIEDQDGPVIFTARIDSLQVQHPRNNDGVIQFPNIITSIGGGYNSSTGVFVAPKTGIYMFSCSLLSDVKSSDGNIQANAEIVKNQSVLARVFTSGEGTSHRGQGSQTVFTHVNRGEHVFIRSISNSNLSLLGEMYSTFSGHLVWSA